MRIVIMGGKGMIGRAVSTLALNRGYEVVILTRQTATQIIPNAKEKTKHWDGKDAVELAEHLKGSDGVINLAGENIGKNRWTPERRDLLLRSRLEPAAALVEALRLCMNPPKVLVQASAIGVYGTGDDAKNEDSAVGEDYLAGFAKRWEKSTSAAEALKIRRVVIRTGIVLQKGAGVLPQLMLPFQLMVGGPVGSGNQIYSWIHIMDEAAAILFLLENEHCKGAYNLTAPNPCSNAEMGKALAKVMHKPYWIPVPGFALKLALGEMSTLVLDGQRVLPRRLESEGFVFKFPELEEALRDLLD
jgi:uncharacterized protein (TIGR01777 family)